MLRAADKWLCGYLRSRLAAPRVPPTDLLVCVADHFEPLQRTILPDGTVTGGADPADVADGIRDWCQRYREGAQRVSDADGRHPVHTFFYPADEYDGRCVEPLSELVRDGLAEVEVHLHHRGDTADGLAEKLEDFRTALRSQHGLLGSAPSGMPLFGFVHGNWALCNARPDGDWCGVNAELGVLKSAGCYADFTFPSAPSPTQPRMVNVPYLASDTGRPRAADRGQPLCAGMRGPLLEHPGLTLIPGPLGPNIGSRKWGILPRLENGELSGANPPSMNRLSLWRRLHVHVPGRPEWGIVKLHTHGWVPANREMLLGDAMSRFHEALGTDAKLRGYRVRFVSARELFNIVAAATAGEQGNPGDLRDWQVAPPPM